MKADFRLPLVISCAFFCLNLCAQKAIVPAGGDSNSAAGSVSYSLGQIRVTQLKDADYSSSEGVQQAYEISIETGYQNEAFPINLSIHPNPVSKVLYIEFPEDLAHLVHYLVTDISGAAVLEGIVDVNSSLINTTNLPEGSYIISFYIAEKLCSSYKIIKIQ
jgi:hypothetical protein